VGADVPDSIAALKMPPLHGAREDSGLIFIEKINAAGVN
jgi:hypothetical protein